MHCCLSEKAKYEHDHAIEAYTKKLYRIGRLFEGRPICVWCYLHIIEMIKPAFVESEIYYLNQMKQSFPNYWSIIESEGLDRVRHEARCQIFEAEPDSNPTRPEQTPGYPTLKVTVDATRGG